MPRTLIKIWLLKNFLVAKRLAQFVRAPLMKGLASHCYSKTTFTFYFSILNIFKCFRKHLTMLKIEKWKVKVVLEKQWLANPFIKISYMKMLRELLSVPLTNIILWWQGWWWWWRNNGPDRTFWPLFWMFHRHSWIVLEPMHWQSSGYRGQSHPCSSRQGWTACPGQGPSNRPTINKQ